MSVRALGFRVNGGPEVFEMVERPVPEPQDGQVLVRVAFAGVNFAEVQHRRGEFGAPDGADGYDVPGLEVSGTVAAVGPGVSALAVGDRVAGYLPAFGGYAEYAVTDPRFVRPVGAVPLAVAASLPVLAPFGRLVAYGDLARSGDWAADVWGLWKSNRTVAGYNIGDTARRSPETIGRSLERALSALGSGTLPYQRPTVVPLSDAPEIHRRMEAGNSRGKTVLAMAD